MSNASHRKPEAVKLPRVPVAYIVTGAILAALVAALLATLAAVTAPAAKASTGYLRPAVVAAKTVDHGYTGQADRVTQWQRVLRHCKVIGCVSHVPAAMARDMGIKHGQAYRVHWGDTTFVWVKLPHGRVRTITS